MASRRGRRIVVLLKWVPQYRVSFYDCLRTRLAEQGIEFLLVYGQPTSLDATRNDSRTVPWGVAVRNRSIAVGRKHLLWQPVFGHLRCGDVVFVEQASKLLVNYVLLAIQALGCVRMGFWGHGRIAQSTRIGEALKSWVSVKSWWWFAYTDGGRRVIEELGYPSERITVLDNAIDTQRLAREVARVRADIERRPGASRGVFVGSLYADKGLRYLLGAARHIHEALPGFQLTIVGDGPDRAMAEEASAEESWISYLGTRFGADLAPIFADADLLLVPGAVGLVVLDAFAAQCPLVTLEGQAHGPEIDYLEDGVNGVLLPEGTPPDGYAAAVINLLSATDRLEHLRRGCRKGAERYTLENMVNRFVEGCLLALRADTD